MRTHPGDENRSYSAEEIDLLDIAIAMAEMWRAVIFLPLGAALIGFLIPFAIPDSFTASLAVAVPRTGEEYATTPMRFALETDALAEVRVADGQVMISATAATAPSAQSAVRSAQSDIIEKAQAYVTEELQKQADLLARMGNLDAREFVEIWARDALLESSDINAVELFTIAMRAAKIESSQNGVAPLLSSVIAGGLMLVAVFGAAILRLHWMAAAGTPEGARKLKRLRQAFRRE